MTAADQVQAFANIPIETRRLRLRRLRESDAEELFAIFSDPKVTRYWGAATWTTLEPAREMIATDLSSATRTHLRLGVERKADDRLLGTCTLFNFHEACRRAEVGYGLGSHAWGRGYMLESLIALLQYGFDVLDLHRVEADIDPRNQPSGRILERLGFQQEGLLRERWIVGDEISDTAFYGLLRREWRPPALRIDDQARTPVSRCPLLSSDDPSPSMDGFGKEPP